MDKASIYLQREQTVGHYLGAFFAQMSKVNVEPLAEEIEQLARTPRSLPG